MGSGVRWVSFLPVEDDSNGQRVCGFQGEKVSLRLPPLLPFPNPNFSPHSCLHSNPCSYSLSQASAGLFIPQDQSTMVDAKGRQPLPSPPPVRDEPRVHSFFRTTGAVRSRSSLRWKTGLRMVSFDAGRLLPSPDCTSKRNRDDTISLSSKSVHLYAPTPWTTADSHPHRRTQ